MPSMLALMVLSHIVGVDEHRVTFAFTMKCCCEPKSDCTGGSRGSQMVYKMLVDLLVEGKLAIDGKFHFR